MDYLSSRNGGVCSSHLDQSYIELLRDTNLYTADIRDVMRQIAKVCGEQLSASRVSIWKLENDCTTLQCLSLYLVGSDSFEQGAELLASDFPSYFAALASHRVIDAHDARRDSRTREFTPSYLRPHDIHSMLDATLRHNDQTEGVLCIEQTGQPRIWNREEQIFAASLADLISRLMIQSQLRDRELRYRTLFDNSAESIFVLVNGLVTDCNKSALSLLRCDRELLINKSPEIFIPSQQADGLISTDLLRARVDAAQPGEHIRFDWVLITLERSELNVEITITKEIFEGETTLIVMVRDVTARKKADKLLLISQQELIHRALHDKLTAA